MGRAQRRKLPLWSAGRRQWRTSRTRYSFSKPAEGFARSFSSGLANAHLKSIAPQPEELLRADEGIGERTGRAGKVGERAGDGGRGLQIETGIGPAQHQLAAEQLKIETYGWLNARRIF